MSNIVESKNKTELVVLRDFELSPSLSTSDSKIIKARLSKRLKNGIVSVSDQQQVISEIGKAINQAFFLSGIKNTYSAEEFGKLTREVNKSLKTFGWISIGDIPIIFENGAKGRYGEFFGINVKTIEGWCIAYEEQDRRKAVLKQQEFEMKKEKELEEERQKKEMEEINQRTRQKLIHFYKQLFEQYQEIKTHRPIAWQQIPQEINEHNVHFQSFRDAGLMEIEKEEKLALWNIAKQEIERDRMLHIIAKDYKKEKDHFVKLAEKKYKDMTFRYKIAEWIMNDVDIAELMEFNNL